MELADAQIIKRGNNVFVKHGDDNGLYVEFYMDALKDEEQTIEKGRPIFADRPFVSIRVLGDNKTHIQRPVKDEDKMRFPRQWEAFERSESQDLIEGTPITEWAMLTKSQAMELKAMAIHTVEKLAEVSDSNLWMGGRELRDKAIKWLETSKDSSAVSKFEAKLKELEAENKALKSEMKALNEASKKKKVK